MNRDKTIDCFSADILNKKDVDESLELVELERKLLSEDFSRESEKDKVLNMTKSRIMKSEEIRMNRLVVKNSEKLNDYTCFKVILPDYLPDGYEFDRAEFFKDESGTVNQTKYINLYFKNGTTENDIFIQQRFADDGTAYSLSTEGNIQKIEINGSDAVITDKSIDWEYNGVLYSLIGNDTVDHDDLMKIAESIR